MEMPETIYTVSVGGYLNGNQTTVHYTSEDLIRRMNEVLTDLKYVKILRDYMNDAIDNYNLVEEVKLDLISEDDTIEFSHFMAQCPSDIGWGFEVGSGEQYHYLNINEQVFNKTQRYYEYRW